VTVTGFVTVSAGQIATTSLPSNRSCPAIRADLAHWRLAVDTLIREGYRSGLAGIRAAIGRGVFPRVGLYAVVWMQTDKAKAIPKLVYCLRDNPLCLYLPVATLERSINLTLRVAGVVWQHGKRHAWLDYRHDRGHSQSALSLLGRFYLGASRAFNRSSSD